MFDTLKINSKINYVKNTNLKLNLCFAYNCFLITSASEYSCSSYFISDKNVL